MQYYCVSYAQPNSCTNEHTNAKPNGNSYCSADAVANN